MELQTLAVNEVEKIHKLLCEEFRDTDKAIIPEGVKDRASLESAVGRQFVSLGGNLKYPDAISNAASLMYGVCCDHPFYNGNKRTSLVTLLAHLERNKFTIEDVSDDELEKRIVYVAAHSFGANHCPPRTRQNPWPNNYDGEISAIIDWLNSHTRKVKRGERPITYRELKKILGKFNIKLENPKDNFIDVIKHESRTTGIFKRKEVHEKKHVWNIVYPGRDGDVVGRNVLKTLREHCHLREEDGVPSDSFYENELVISGFINRYRKILCRLGNK
jgi:death-on-curing protein